MPCDKFWAVAAKKRTWLRYFCHCWCCGAVANPNIAIANMYSYHYSKLTSLLDKFIAPNEQFIEGLIGVHLLVLSTEKGYLNYGDNDNIDFFKETIYLYENDNYIGNQEIKETVLNMREVSKKIFSDYWKRPNKNKKSKRRAA